MQKFFRHLDTSAFIKNICRYLQDLSCGGFSFPDFRSTFFKVFFLLLFLFKTCLSAYL